MTKCKTVSQLTTVQQPYYTSCSMYSLSLSL